MNQPPIPPVWALKLKNQRESGVPMRRLRARYHITDEGIERLYKLYGWEWDEVIAEAPPLRKRPTGSRSSRRLPDTAPISVTLSERQRAAWQRYGVEGLREALAALEEDVDLIALENLGVGEEAHSTKLALQRTDVIRIDVLDSRHRSRHQHAPSKALVVRQALERLILLRNDEELKKPSDWEAKPLDGAQGGKSAWNLGETLTKSFTVPLYLYKDIEHMRSKRGTTAHDPRRVNLSRWVRDAVEGVKDPNIPQYLPVTSRKIKGYTTAGTIPMVLKIEQIERLAAIQSATGCNQSEALSAAIAHALQFEPEPEIWKVWRRVVTEGMDAAAVALETTPDELGQRLVDTGYLKPSQQAAKMKIQVPTVTILVAEQPEEAKPIETIESTDAFDSIDAAE